MASGLLIWQLTPLAAAADVAHLTHDATGVSPANGESLPVDSVAAFDPDGGRATIEPGTEYAETLTYSAVDPVASALLDVERPDPQGHPTGAEIRPEDHESSDTASPPPATSDVSPSPSAAPDGSETGDADANEAPQSTSGPDVSSSQAPTEQSSTGSAPSQAVPQVVGAVLFDDIAGLPSPDPSCGYAGFRAVSPTLAPITDRPGWTATATTEVSAALPQTYSGTLDSSGRAVIYYCPPAGLLNKGPFEVTFTATVQAATGTAIRTWDRDLGLAATEVITAVTFDDTYGLPTGISSCGWAGFTAYAGALQPARQHESYTVTATTEATLSAPQTWTGSLDDSGRGVVYYCPPPGVFAGQATVVFTATVQGVTGVAERTWSMNVNQPTLPAVDTTFYDETIPDSPADETLGPTLLGLGGGPVGLETSVTDYPHNHTCYIYKSTYGKGHRGAGDNAYYGVDKSLGAHAAAEAHSGGATITRRHSDAWAIAGGGFKWYGPTANAYMSLPWDVVGSQSTEIQDIPFQSSSASVLTEAFVGVLDRTTGATVVEERVASWSQQGESFHDRTAQGSKRYYFVAEHKHSYVGYVRITVVAESDTPTPYLSSSAINDFLSANRKASLVYVAMTVPDYEVRCG